MFLGNDLVNWTGDAAREKAVQSGKTRRFVDRILHPSEHKLLNNPASLALPRFKVLWALWAAKEATFKAAIKAAPGLIFSPRSIRVRVTSLYRDTPRWWPLGQDVGNSSAGCPGQYHCAGVVPLVPLARGWARVRDRFYEILWEACDDYVHALALGPWFGLGSPGTPGSTDFSDNLWDRVIHRVQPVEGLWSDADPDADTGANRESLAVRQLAQRLYRSMRRTSDGIENPEIRRVRLPSGRLAPPAFSGFKTQPPLDLTMSHDGQWVAAGLFAGDNRQT